MKRLKQKLIIQFADHNTKVLTPENCQSVEMYFNSQKIAKVRGKLAEETPQVGEIVSGLLVKKGFTYQDPECQVQSILLQAYFASSIEVFKNVGPSVVMASPSGL
ncbi:hypothetical protein Fmac_010184 [Flemingia macrophylla]|uniref:Uncharacterized protein n=1 Tax=Flemingia macrophylla TaxID=520843 RepID=A0ABD1N2B1_9FABA